MFLLEKSIKSSATTYFSGNNLYIGQSNGNIQKIVNTNNECCLKWEFKSHKPEFDYLESNDISEKIVSICLLNSELEDRFICANEKTLRMWNVVDSGSVADRLRKGGYDLTYFNLEETGEYSKDDQFFCGGDFKDEKSKKVEYSQNIDNCSDTDSSDSSLNQKYDIKTELLCEKKNIHSYPINTIVRQGDVLISSDYLRIMMWNLNKMDYLKIIDVKPDRFEELSFVITQVNYCDDDTFAYSTSSGEIVYCDLRVKSVPQIKLKMAKPVSNDLFAELLKSISSFRFKDNFVFARNFNSILTFDLRNGALSDNLTLFKADFALFEKIYRNNSGYDRFSIEINNDKIITGGFDGEFFVYNINGDLTCQKTSCDDSMKYCCFWQDKIVVCSKNEVMIYRDG
ncbi:Protein phosphatase PP2A regulatory subunit B [Dictyocoela muelleri]|nr:Protein phosphatase PP2A regulatory subunit B [Dictyocoela muelleri]